MFVLYTQSKANGGGSTNTAAYASYRTSTDTPDTFTVQLSNRNGHLQQTAQINNIKMLHTYFYL